MLHPAGLWVSDTTEDAETPREYYILSYLTDSRFGLLISRLTLSARLLEPRLLRNGVYLRAGFARARYASQSR
jgi:hypothetical protein